MTLFSIQSKGQKLVSVYQSAEDCFLIEFKILIRKTKAFITSFSTSRASASSALKEAELFLKE